MLDGLMAGAREDADRRRQTRSAMLVEREALAQPPALDAVSALASPDAVRIIAEIKRASPSRGALAKIADPVGLARDYERGGAAAISVLTEERRFNGSLEDLQAVREAVSVPVLRKEFISTEYQLLEARAAGADMILLIVAALSQAELQRLKYFAEDLGMHALVETHTREEFERALDLNVKLLGVNARDLSTFELHPHLFAELAAETPAGIVRVAESAVKTPADVRSYRDAGADAVLIGEALVTGQDPARTIEEFIAA